MKLLDIENYDSIFKDGKIKIIDYLAKIDEVKMKLNTLRKVEKANSNPRDTKINENLKSKNESTWIQHKLEKIKEMKKQHIFRDEFKILEGTWYNMETRKPSLKVNMIKVTLRKLDFGKDVFFLSENEILN